MKTRQNTNALNFTCLILVVLHLGVNIWHGVSHHNALVATTAFQDGFIYSIIIAAPLAAVLLLFSHWRKQGYLVLSLTMFAAFVFGLLFHFVIQGNDHVAAVPEGEWKVPFFYSSILLAALELTIALLALAGWMRSRTSTTQR